MKGGGRSGAAPRRVGTSCGDGGNTAVVMVMVDDGEGDYDG